MNTKGKIVALFVILAIGAFVFWLLGRVPDASLEEPKNEKTETAISISEEKITEENFSGSLPIISGSGVLAEKAKNHVGAIFADFKERADQEVPEMRAEFGSESPTAFYVLDVQAEYLLGETTESIVVSEYYYTGGANGTSSYTVFTSSLETGEILSLAEIIPEEKQADFISFLKERLTAWRPEDALGMIIFPETLEELSFASLSDWSLDGENNLRIYFDEYEIAPGAMGAFAFLISQAELAPFRMTN